jgi:hypothetical protein
MTPLVTALRARDSAALSKVLADDVAFHSPVADYEGKETVLHLLTLASGLLEGFDVRSRLGGNHVTATFIASGELHGVLHERREGDRVVELTLMLRPLRPMLDTIKRMGAALERAAIS